MSRMQFAVTSLITAFLCSTGWAATSRPYEANEYGDVGRGLAGAKITMSQSFEIALCETPKAKAIAAKLKYYGRQVKFEVVVAVGELRQRVEVDAITGEFREGEDQGAETGEIEDAAAKAAVPLEHAVEIAEKRLPFGKAFEAKPKWKSKTLVWEMQFFVNDRAVKAELDATTGKVLEIIEEK